MSDIVFGDFISDKVNTDTINALKQTVKQKGVLLWFDDEVDFDPDITRMLQENGLSENSVRFFITTEDQPPNSEELIEPWETYTHEELFPHGGNDRTVFCEIAKQHLERFRWTLKCLTETFSPRCLRVFVTDAYDNEFVTVSCTIDEMVDAVLKQITEYGLGASTIYAITPLGIRR
jgi:hypothetical protein